jgi:hypothetical protein
VTNQLPANLPGSAAVVAAICVLALQTPAAALTGGRWNGDLSHCYLSGLKHTRPIPAR